MLKKAFSKAFEGLIWKIRPDEKAEYLALEIRDADKREASFYAVRTHSGELSFGRLQLQEPWFCGLEGAAHGKAYLHAYLSESLPGHRGIFAYSLDDGTLSWEDHNLVFSHAAKEGLVAWNYKAEPRKYQLIDPSSGDTLNYFSSLDEVQTFTHALPPPPMAFPSRVSLEEDCLELLPARTLPGADMLDLNDLFILAFYTRADADDKAMDHHLYVFDRNRKVLHQDLLAEGILHPALDTFFVIGRQLYYIKSKSEILGYFL